MTVTEQLFELKDDTYADFQSKLVPGIPRDRIIGVRVPVARKLAKTLCKQADIGDFLDDLPHKYYDENILHGIIISEMKDFYECIRALDIFLPYVDNWAVCDIISPKVFKKHKTELVKKTKEWMNSTKAFTVRFGMEILMNFFLDADFKPEYLKEPATIQSEEYYVKMMQAWFFATALTKQWKDTIPYIKNKKLDAWTHNKTIQKARESRVISLDNKEYLKTLKIK